MNGRVEDNHALIPVSLRVPEQPDLSIEFVIDTGFIGVLTLPITAVDVLGLPFVRSISVELADGSYTYVSIHLAVIMWHGVERVVEVLATGRRRLLGTLLLAGSKLNAHVIEAGLLSIDGSPAFSG